MIAQTYAQLEQRAVNFVERLRDCSAQYECEIVRGESAVGGGSAPTTHPPTALIRLTHPELPAHRLEQKLRQETHPPVVARLVEDRLVLDLRTVADDEEDELLEAFRNSEEAISSTKT